MNLSELKEFLHGDNYSEFKDYLIDSEQDRTIGGVEFKFIRCDFCPLGDRNVKQLVFSVNGNLFALDGYYSSWDGTNWGDGDIYEVTKKTKEITYYA